MVSKKKDPAKKEVTKKRTYKRKPAKKKVQVIEEKSELEKTIDNIVELNERVISDVIKFDNFDKNLNTTTNEEDNPAVQSSQTITQAIPDSDAEDKPIQTSNSELLDPISVIETEQEPILYIGDDEDDNDNNQHGDNKLFSNILYSDLRASRIIDDDDFLLDPEPFLSSEPDTNLQSEPSEPIQTEDIPDPKESDPKFDKLNKIYYERDGKMWLGDLYYLFKEEFGDPDIDLRKADLDTAKGTIVNDDEYTEIDLLNVQVFADILNDTELREVYDQLYKKYYMTRLLKKWVEYVNKMIKENKIEEALNYIENNPDLKEYWLQKEAIQKSLEEVSLWDTFKRSVKLVAKSLVGPFAISSVKRMEKFELLDNENNTEKFTEALLKTLATISPLLFLDICGGLGLMATTNILSFFYEKKRKKTQTEKELELGKKLVQHESQLKIEQEKERLLIEENTYNLNDITLGKLDSQNVKIGKYRVKVTSASEDVITICGKNVYISHGNLSLSKINGNDEQGKEKYEWIINVTVAADNTLYTIKKLVQLIINQGLQNKNNLSKNVLICPENLEKLLIKALKPYYERMIEVISNSDCEKLPDLNEKFITKGTNK